MPTFQITGPDGKKYRVSGDTPEGAMQALRKMVDKPAAAQPQHREFDGSNIPGYNPKTGMVERQFGKGESGAYGAADVTTFGFGDEISSFIASMLPGVDKPREQILSEMRGSATAAQEQNPGSYLTGQLAGGIAQGVAAGPAILQSSPSLLARAGGGAATGAGLGGLYGAGSGEGMADRGVEALKGAGVGAVAGGAFPMAAAGASKTYSTIANALLGRKAAQQAGSSPEALRMLGNVMEGDATRGPVGAANMARAGSEAMLADAGPNARAILDTAIQRGGPGGVQAQRAITDRAGRSATAVTGALDQNLGQPQGVTAARAAIRQGSAPARGSAYDDAYRQAIDYADPRGQALEGLVRGRVPQSAINRANELMRAEGHESQQILARVADDGSVTFERLPDVRQIDYITRGLNDLAEAGEGAGAMGGQNALGRAYQNLSRDIRDNLRDLVPEYGTALETAADPIRRSKAVEFGSKLLSAGTTRDQVDEFAKGLTGPERDALAQGVRSRLDDMMANVTRTVQDGNTDAREAVKAIKDLSSRANREKLTAAIGKQKADALFDEIDRAATSFDLRASVAENSKTYARQATDRRISEITAPGPIGTLAQGKPINAAQRVVQALTGQTPDKVAGRQDAIYSELARILTQPAGQSRALFSTIDQLGQSDQATRLMAGRIAQALSGPRLSYPSSAPVIEWLRGDRRTAP